LVLFTLVPRCSSVFVTSSCLVQLVIYVELPCFFFYEVCCTNVLSLVTLWETTGFTRGSLNISMRLALGNSLSSVFTDRVQVHRCVVQRKSLATPYDSQRDVSSFIQEQSSRLSGARTHTHTRARALCRRVLTDQLVVEAPYCQNKTQETNIHAVSWIRTRHPWSNATSYRTASGIGPPMLHIRLFIAIAT
jgi:hypothetical protein